MAGRLLCERRDAFRMEKMDEGLMTYLLGTSKVRHVSVRATFEDFTVHRLHGSTRHQWGQFHQNRPIGMVELGE